MTTQHAPTPWILDIGDTRRPFPFIMAPEGGPGMMVAEVVSGRLDAAFIVRACNSYNDLLAALKLLLDQEANMAGECGWCFQSPFGHCERATCPGVIARAALERAEKGA